MQTEKQKVHFGHTQSGRPGLFTGAHLAVPLREEETTNPRAVAERMGFAYEGQPHAEGSAS